MQPNILEVAVPVPLRRRFHYLAKDEAQVKPGCRVLVPFGRRQLVGVVLGHTHTSEYLDKLKPVLQVLDDDPILDDGVLELLLWSSRYYHHAIGEVFQNAIPVKLRYPPKAEKQSISHYEATAEGLALELDSLKRAKKQQLALSLLRDDTLSREELETQGVSMSSLKILLEKGLIQGAQPPEPEPFEKSEDWCNQNNKPQLNTEQAIATAAIIQELSHFGCFLLQGVTGSGKTEVYLQVMEQALARDKQVLLLVPEIGLTPQTLHRFERRFKLPIAMLHSGMNDTQRLQNWQQVCKGDARILIGTRSSVFTPMPELGLIIVDEEHDASLKQQDGFRYHARDLAVKRARDLNIPIVLGSATPALETLHNAQSGKYKLLQLTQRTSANQVRHGIIDLKQQVLQQGLSQALIDAIKQTLDKNEQVILFLNRRGYAPALICHECSWTVECPRCLKPYTFHKQSRRLVCHHCTGQRPVPHQCGDCGSTRLITLGLGTEQLEKEVAQRFPQHSVLRIDRDSTSRKDQLKNYLEEINANKHQILIGTQMLAKGHHFPNVTLVGILDVDGALFSADFRATERLAQLLIQVAGRAGRADKAGTVLLQTHNPQHPLLPLLLHKGYDDFARHCLQERQHTLLPPFSHQGLFRCQSHRADLAENFLQQVAATLNQLQHIEVLGPMPSAMEKKAGKYRFLLLIQSESRAHLHQALHHSLPQIEALPLATKVQWNLDIDPSDIF